ncbi:hypothetical protein K505DRAFT_388080 [Melanomma pulvis-pyrius CBS 109.77]|uniref:Uncharacterized protein n=1 Tax=Melanomma pulvis-pyrius CBS 109.77 TaxID=1314802 RepID=A0A6A6XT19_9PLEO|nr:hypothetical protein K505DRAFT_388080 [Melanomma pulvis-pyrius CBS 109.77]
MLYCSLTWWSDRGFPPPSPNVQIRPTFTEAAHLSKRGLIKRVERNSDCIVPIIRHLTVQKYYRNNPLPQPLQIRYTPGRKTSAPELHEAAPKESMISAPPTPAPVYALAPQPIKNLVNSSLDPRLRDKITSGHTFTSSSYDPEVSADNEKHSFRHGNNPQYHANSTTIHDPHSDMDSDTLPLASSRIRPNRMAFLETPHGGPPQRSPTPELVDSELRTIFQQLEAKFRRVQRENKRLKAENAELRKCLGQSNGYEAGAKRPRYDEDML